MGITISSKRYSCDMGHGGFGRFRNIIASKVGGRFAGHYLELSDPQVMCLFGSKRDEFFKKYNATTRELIEQKEITPEVANFLYKSDCNGKIDRKQAKQIYELIKNCPDDTIFGYAGRDDCAKMADLKKIFSDGTKVEWY